MTATRARQSGIDVCRTVFSIVPVIYEFSLVAFILLRDRWASRR